MIRTRCAALLLLAATLPLGLPAMAAEDIQLRDAWARASIGAGTAGAAYLSLENRGTDKRLLVGVASPRAARAMIHESRRDADGVMRMIHRDRLALPPGATVRFAPGGLHVMLIGLDAPLVEGETLDLTLRFAGRDPIAVTVPIVGATAHGPDG